ncbi:MAG: RDD family protein [Halobacteriota archaeon]
MAGTDMQLAGLGSRAIAIIIDTIVLIIIGAGLAAFTVGFGPSPGDAGNLVIGAIGLLYFIVLEAYADGQTLGKKLVNIKVVTEDGDDLDLVGSLIRNVLRIIDALPFFYIIGIIVIVVSDDNQRIGDIVGNTLVVKA